MRMLEVLIGLWIFVPMFMAVMWLPGYLAQKGRSGLGYASLVIGMSTFIGLVLGYSYLTRHVL